MPLRREVIWLVGERRRPVLEVDGHYPVELPELGLTPATSALVERWLGLLRADLPEQRDEALLAGVRAATAIAQEFEFLVRVNLAMRDRGDEWLRLDVRDPADDRW